MIEVKGLCCGYGSHSVIQGLDLSVCRGEMIGVLGPNGSGKTTLFLALSGVLPITSGHILIDGQDRTRLDPKTGARIMASVPQKAGTTFAFHCLSLVLMGRYPYTSPFSGYSQHDIAISQKAMQLTGTLDLAERSVERISGGEFQLVLMARALAQSSKILLLDEATSNLDVARKIQIFDLLKQENRNGLTLMCVMHDLNLAALYCERLVFLKQGRIVLDGSVEDVFNEKELSRIYETQVKVVRHPVTGKPQVHFVPGNSVRDSITMPAL